MQRIVLASTNKGKLQELQEGLLPAGFDIIPHAVSDIEETACTFVENALLKARSASQEAGLPAIADDSGLVVPVLNGQPGIHSARFAGSPQNAMANISKLLTCLKDVPQDQRAAWFHCSLVWLASPEDPAPIICQGQWHGHILTAPRGENGFGYDSIFYDANEGKSAAELSAADKNRLSHRGKALKQLIRLLSSSSAE